MTVTLWKPYRDSNYTITCSGGTGVFGNTSCYNKTPTTFQAWTSDDSSFNAGYLGYQCIGYVN